MGTVKEQPIHLHSKWRNGGNGRVPVFENLATDSFIEHNVNWFYSNHGCINHKMT